MNTEHFKNDFLEIRKKIEEIAKLPYSPDFFGPDGNVFQGIEIPTLIPMSRDLFGEIGDEYQGLDVDQDNVIYKSKTFVEGDFYDE